MLRFFVLFCSALPLLSCEDKAEKVLEKVIPINNNSLKQALTPVLRQKLSDHAIQVVDNEDIIRKCVSESIETVFNHKDIEANTYKIESENSLKKARLAVISNIATALITATVVLAVQFTECQK